MTPLEHSMQAVLDAHGITSFSIHITRYATGKVGFNAYAHHAGKCGSHIGDTIAECVGQAVQQVKAHGPIQIDGHVQA